MQKKNSYLNQLKDLFHEMDTNESGSITLDEIIACFEKDDRARAYLSVLEINVEEAKGLFNLLDVDDSGEVGIHEFIMGCMRLKGTAKSIDVATMLCETKRMNHKMNTFFNVTVEELRLLRSSLGPVSQSNNDMQRRDHS